jgi:hypothetical protein
MCNRYPSIKELGDKDIFGNMMTFCSQLMPDVFNFAPPTFNLPGHESKMAEYAKGKKN